MMQVILKFKAIVKLNCHFFLRKKYQRNRKIRRFSVNFCNENPFLNHIFNKVLKLMGLKTFPRAIYPEKLFLSHTYFSKNSKNNIHYIVQDKP